MAYPAASYYILSVKKDEADICDDVVAAVEGYAKVTCCLHNQNAVALDCGQALIRVAAGLIGISAFVAEHAAGG